ALQGGDHVADRGLFIEGRQAKADRQTVAPLEPDEAPDVAKLARVKGVLGEPLVHHGGNVGSADHDWRHRLVHEYRWDGFGALGHDHCAPKWLHRPGHPRASPVWASREPTSTDDRLASA